MYNKKNTDKKDIVKVIIIGDNANDILRLDCCTGVLKTEDGRLLYLIQVGGKHECAFAGKGDRLCRLRNGRWKVGRDGEELVQICVGMEDGGGKEARA